MITLIVALLAVLAVARPALAIYRLIRMGRAARSHYRAALWAKMRWRWLARNLGLAYVDLHRRGGLLHIPGSTSVRISVEQSGRAKLRYPRAKIRADEFGIRATLKTVPKVGRRQLDDQAEHIANAWRCVRAQVHQTEPGRVEIRGLRRDPLTLPYPASAAPAGVYDGLTFHQPGGGTFHQPGGGIRLYLGLDEWGNHRWIPLSGVTGITVGGLPGYGKTEFVKSVLAQLAPVPLRLVLIDGKGGGDYHDWKDRAWIYCEDELADAAAALEETHGEMRSRLGSVFATTGYRNAWRVGPTPALPLLLTVIDEAHTYFDLDAVKGDQTADRLTRTCRKLAGQLVRKGRSVLAVTVILTQKQTSDAVPTFIRDNCRHGLSFAVKTRDAAVAALGEGIREYPSYCPSGLQDPAYIGVATAALRTGHDPFVRLRVPELSEQAAAERAASTAGNRPDIQRDTRSAPEREPSLV